MYLIRFVVLGVIVLLISSHTVFAEMNRWSQIPAPVQGGYVTALAADAIHPEHLYIHVDEVGIFASDNAGKNWHYTGDTGYNFHKIISTHPTKSGVAFAGTGITGEIYKTVDYGKHWKKVYSFGCCAAPSIFGFEFYLADPNIIYAQLSGSILIKYRWG